MDYKNVKEAKYAFKFNQPLIKLWRIDTQTGEETYMGDDWIRGVWAAYTWKLDNDKSWVSVKVRKDRIFFWIKEVADVNKKTEATHYQIIVGKNDEQKVAVGEADEMIREGLSWKKKNE